MTDAELQQRVIKHLANATAVDAPAVGVSVRAGVVTLDGIVTEEGVRSAIVRAVLGIAGVLDVANDIEVRPRWKHAPADPDIAHAIRRQLEELPEVPHQRVQVIVEPNGHVTLRGFLPSPSECRAVAKAAWVEGVYRVIDELVPEHR